MIYNYGFSFTGKSHVSSGAPCQDYHFIRQEKSGRYIAAIADGVGSAANAETGSRIAAETAVKFCVECMPSDYSTISIKSMIRTAFNYALKKIAEEAEKSGESLASYDTTLTLVIYDGARIIYGHSGDGAILGLTAFGDYVVITDEQKGEDHISVIPLRQGYTSWKIDTYGEDLAAVILVTDGMFGAICPGLLKMKDYDPEQNCKLYDIKPPVYPALAAYFSDPAGIPEDEEALEKFKVETGAFLLSDEEYDTDRFYARLDDIYKARIPERYEEIIAEIKKNDSPCRLVNDIRDDKTLVVLGNTDMPTGSKEPEYYEEPDWQTLNEEFLRILYPGRITEKTYGEKENTEENESDSDEENDLEYTHPEKKNHAFRNTLKRIFVKKKDKE